MSDKIYQYYVLDLRVIKEDPDYATYDHALEDKLNELGQRGWDCFAINNDKAYFKMIVKG